MVTTQGQSKGVVCAEYWLRTPGRGCEELGKEQSRLCLDLTYILHRTFNIRKHLQILKVLALQIITCNLLVQ